MLWVDSTRRLPRLFALISSVVFEWQERTTPLGPSTGWSRREWWISNFWMWTLGVLCAWPWQPDPTLPPGVDARAPWMAA